MEHGVVAVRCATLDNVRGSYKAEMLSKTEVKRPMGNEQVDSRSFVKHYKKYMTVFNYLSFLSAMNMPHQSLDWCGIFIKYKTGDRKRQ